MKGKINIVAKTLHGLEAVLAKEIETIGGENVKAAKRVVYFEGDKELLYKANYTLRTALRVLVPVYDFRFHDVDDFYDRLYNHDWAQYMNPEDTFAIDNVVYSSKFKNTQFAVYRFKDALCDYFVRNHRRRPSVNTSHPKVQFNLHVSEDRCTISLDSSGESLHKRGYRFSEGLAPINEVLAAGMLQMTGWDGKRTLIDPMCGSGTFLIEAVMWARKIPAGSFRHEFGFMHWQDFDKALWKKVKTTADSEICPLEATVIGADENREVLRAVRVNLRRTKLHMDVKTYHTDFEHFENSYNDGIFLTNPPYGERIGKGEIKELYGGIGTKLKHDFQGFDAWIISAPKENFKHIGLRPSQKINLYNGPLEAQFQHFELYQGSKKENYM